MFAGD